MRNVRGIWLPDGDHHIAGHLERGPEFEGKGTYQLAKIQACVDACKMAGRTGLAIDVGAHVGTWSRVLARSFKAVIAFEPMHHLFDCLELNVDELDNVNCHNIAIGAAPGRVDMIKAVDNSGNCRVADGDHSGKTSLVCQALDGFEFGPGIDFIKVDVEGYEVNVLRGGEQVIKRDRPLIVIEQKPATDGRYGFTQFEARDLLVSWGMREIYYRSGDHLMSF